ncbi:FtsX-like permease family protein [Fluviispira sanaruensis]|uniref:Lipoprotein-releasing system transmembrane subunit LolC n=1 Tax=Fluviispira sanaruensis TaxID=2493639 RepID=A0A4P2VM22_FLUSA|nr:FtsX-like permease family protein [Fluviispira sanaruensis]BBH54406.1 lipoprotein-releasing system transmembrane subunit LolC [Fluviispira sanaruensis]
MTANSKAIRFLLHRYLISSWASKSRRSASAIGVLLPVLGVAIGVFAFTVVLSVMGGFVTNIKSHLLNMQAHIEVVSSERAKQIPENTELMEKIRSLSDEIVAISPYQSGDVILQSGSRGAMARLEGIDPTQAEGTLNLQKYISDDITLNILNRKLPAENITKSDLFPTVILTLDLMNQLGLHVGDSLTLVSTVPDDGIGGFAPTQFPVVIAGYINSGHFSFNQKRVFTSLKTANLFFQNDKSWLGLQLKLNKPLEAEHIAKVLDKTLLPQGLRSKPWTESNSALLKVLTLERFGMSFVMLMIILVSCFSISISLLLTIRRKSNEMAILRSLGFEQSDLSKLFLWQGFLIGFAGVLLGLLLGGIALYFIHNYQIPFITTSYSSKPLPVLIDIYEIIFISLGSILLAMLAAVWPAIEVRNLDVIEVLSVRN